MNKSIDKNDTYDDIVSPSTEEQEKDLQNLAKEMFDLQEYAETLETNTLDRYIGKRLTKMELAGMRKSRRITQKQVAEATGLSIRCISDIESEDGGNPTLNNLIKYLDCMGYEICFQKKII